MHVSLNHELIHLPVAQEISVELDPHFVALPPPVKKSNKKIKGKKKMRLTQQLVRETQQLVREV